MENKVLIGIHMDFEVAVDATEENYDAIKAFVTYLDGNKDRLVEALQNLIDPYYEAVRAGAIKWQKEEHEKVKQKVVSSEDPLGAGAYSYGLEEAEEMKEGDLRHIVREALKRKLLKEQDFGGSSMLGIHTRAGYFDDAIRAEKEAKEQEQIQRDYIDLEYGEGAYDESQFVDADVPYESPLDDPLAHPQEIHDYRVSGDIDPSLLQSDATTGETLYGGEPVSQLPWYDDWKSVRTPIFPFSPEHFAHPERPYYMGTGEVPAYPETRFGGIGARPAIKGAAKQDKPAKPHHHMGVDISVAEGTPILSPTAGTVYKMVKDHESRGNYVVIKTQHPKTGEFIYHNFYHLDKLPDLEEGNPVSQGQEVGLAGDTGKSFGSHLHWSIARHDPESGEPHYGPGEYDKYIDPAAYLADLGGYDWAKDYAIQPEGGERSLYGKRREIPKDWETYDYVAPDLIASDETSTTPKAGVSPQTNESQLRYAIQEALKRKLSPLKEVEEMSSAKLYQVVLVLKVSQPIRDIKGKLNRIRAIEGVTIVSHEREEETIYRGDVVAKVKFHPMNDMMTPATFINQYLIPQINDSKIVPEVKVLKTVQGTIKEIT
jgi:murein DD-endopeptidase MepM/ murein hydrolase activator NlpD